MRNKKQHEQLRASSWAENGLRTEPTRKNPAKPLGHFGLGHWFLWEVRSVLHVPNILTEAHIGSDQVTRAMVKTRGGSRHP